LPVTHPLKKYPIGKPHKGLENSKTKKENRIPPGPSIFTEKSNFLLISLIKMK
jgi:hypothetical protein